MAGMQLSKTIDAPRERVFEAFTDLDRMAERIEGIERVEKLTDGPMRVGTRWKETRVMFKRESTEELEVTGFDPPESYRVECDSCGSHFTSVFRFEPEGDATRVTMEMSYRATSLFAKLFRPIGFLMAGSIKKCIDQDLDDAKRAIEAETAPAA